MIARCILLLLLLSVVARSYAQETPGATPGVTESEAFTQMRRFTMVMEQVRAHYVDEEEVSYKELIDAALDGMLKSLDPHSQFVSKQSYEGMRDRTSGERGIVGLSVGMRNGSLIVISPIEGTPAWDSGILKDDLILKIDAAVTEGLTLQEVSQALRGDPGTKVTLTIRRPSSGKTWTVDLLRQKHQVSSVSKTVELEGEIAYVRVFAFARDTAGRVLEELNRATETDASAMILDMRGNPGGLVQAAVDVCSVFLEKGELVVYTQGRDRSSRQNYYARGWRHNTALPLVILINGSSASSAEIVAGCLQDHKRALLVGERSYGKGSVQSVLPMKDGAALRLTTAKYYTPEGRLIHQRGVLPDIVVPLSRAEWIAIARHRDPAAEDAPEDPQLARTLDVIKGLLILAPEKDEE